MRGKIDVVVIGAGIVGVSTAYHLLRRSKRVLLLDRLGAGLETSFGNSGIIETSYVLPFRLPPLKRFPGILLDLDTAVRIHYPSLPQFLSWIANFSLNSRSLSSELHGRAMRPLVATALDEHLFLMQTTEADTYLTRKGRVKLHRSYESFCANAPERKIAQELGVPFDVMDAQEFKEIEPFVAPLYSKAVLWTGSARLTNPSAVTRAYADRFVREGGSFKKQQVKSLSQRADQSWSVVTDTEEIHTAEVVMCAGPWAYDCLKPLGYDFPLRPKRGYHTHFKALGSATLSHALVDVDIGYLICPMEQGYRLTTGVEFASLKTKPTPLQIDRVLSAARALFPLGASIDPKPWHGSRPCFPDSLPAIGRAPHHQGLWFNIGHGHSGLTTGPTSGRLLAELLVGAPPFCSADAFDPGRDMRIHLKQRTRYLK